MVDIIVRRNGGHNPGDDIVDPLIATVAIALVRGRNELDARAAGKSPVILGAVPRAGLLPGQVIEVNDALQGRTYRARIVSVSYRKVLARSRCVLSVERVSEFQS